MTWSRWRARGYLTFWSAIREAARRRWPGVRPARRSRPRRSGRPVFTVFDALPDAPAGAVALTLDDGPDPVWTPAVLEVLARHRVHATFFLVGQRALDHPDLAARVLAEGHTLGNHSMWHPQPFPARPVAELVREIGTAQRSISSVAGPPRLFRAPAGNWSPQVLRVVRSEGLTPVDWTVDPADWRSPGVQAIADVLVECRPGDILLCHDGGGDRSQTVEALDRVIPRLQERGMTFVTL